MNYYAHFGSIYKPGRSVLQEYIDQMRRYTEFDSPKTEPMPDPVLNCECGSGSNLLGPGHSAWCRCFRAF